MAEYAPNGNRREGQLTVSQTLQTYTQLLQRVSLLRAGVTFGGDRDLYQTLGYQRTLRYEDYYARYLRGGIAARIINAFPDATWREDPIVRDTTKQDELAQSPFEEAFAALAKRLGLWEHLIRVDRLASLGHYAVLVLGLRGQTQWNTEAQRVRGPDDLLYIQAFSQEHANILSLVSDSNSPRFGRPLSYNIDFSRRLSDTSLIDPLLRPALTHQYAQLIDVHASRVIHVAENGLEDPIIGTPRLQALWNDLDALEKVLGGSAEMFWQDAKRRLVLNLKEGAVLEDPEGLSTEVEEFMHELRNFLRVQGMDVIQLNGQIPDPSGNANVLLDVIAGTAPIPKRILFGSERGELASDQDEQNWLAGTILTRQKRHAEQGILRQFIDRCMLFNILPSIEDYAVDWPPPRVPTEEERAKIALIWTQAIATFAGKFTAPKEILPLGFFLRDILEWDREEVENILQQLAEELATLPPLDFDPGNALDLEGVNP